MSPDGRRRAEALARWIPRAFPQIRAIFAASAKPRSNRPAETVEPLAAALGLMVDTRFGDGQTTELARLLLSGACPGAAAVVCWRHETLPELARALGARDAPARWDTLNFDQVWRLDYGRCRSPDLHILSQEQEERRVKGG